jgi:hypothetical protein
MIIKVAGQRIGGWEDSMVPLHAVRPSGTSPPTWENGFKGDANMFALNFVHNQADEIFFTVQLQHSREVNSLIYPHVHFSPFAALGVGTYACRFILKWYYASIGGAFSAEQTTNLEATWTAEEQWVHKLANPAAGISFNSGISTVIHARLTRDNTITNNFAGKLSYLGFDIHYAIDSLGSHLEQTK